MEEAMIKKEKLLFPAIVFLILIAMSLAGCNRNESDFTVKESSIVQSNVTYTVVINSSFNDDITITYQEKKIPDSVKNSLQEKFKDIIFNDNIKIEYYNSNVQLNRKDLLTQTKEQMTDMTINKLKELNLYPEDDCMLNINFVSVSGILSNTQTYESGSVCFSVELYKSYKDIYMFCNDNKIMLEIGNNTINQIYYHWGETKVINNDGKVKLLPIEDVIEKFNVYFRKYYKFDDSPRHHRCTPVYYYINGETIHAWLIGEGEDGLTNPISINAVTGEFITCNLFVND